MTSFHLLRNGPDKIKFMNCSHLQVWVRTYNVSAQWKANLQLSVIIDSSAGGGAVEVWSIAICRLKISLKIILMHCAIEINAKWRAGDGEIDFQFFNPVRSFQFFL